MGGVGALVMRNAAVTSQTALLAAAIARDIIVSKAVELQLHGAADGVSFSAITMKITLITN